MSGLFLTPIYARFRTGICRILVTSASMPKQGAPVILRIVALAVEDDTARPRDMSECMIETLPWPEWVRSLGLVEEGAMLCK